MKSGALHVDALYRRYINAEITRAEYVLGLHRLLAEDKISECEWYYGMHMVSGLRIPEPIPAPELENGPCEFVQSWTMMK